MSYKNGEELLPKELLEEVQKYVEGEILYIPKKKENRLDWGSNTNILEVLSIRNNEIYEDYLKGYTANELSDIYFLSIKSIERIILKMKKQKA